MPNNQKRSIVTTLSDKLQKDTSFAILQHSGLSHQKFEELRKALYKISANIKIQVAKNSLLSLAITRFIDTVDHKNNTAKSDLASSTKEQNSLLVMDGYWSETLATIKKFSKDLSSIKVKFGFVDGNFYGLDGMTRLAALPSREMLIGKLLATMKAPSTRTVMSLKSPMQKLVYVLNAKSKAN